jgi:hypothetical protein
MHEANAVRTAIKGAVAEREAALAEGAAAGHPSPDAGAFRHLELEIIDPTRATPEAVQVYAPVILDELALRGVSFDVFVRAVRCSMCGRTTHAEPADPVCRSCGAPVPCTEGPAIIARWTKPITTAAPAQPLETGTALADHHRRHVARVFR